MILLVELYFIRRHFIYRVVECDYIEIGVVERLDITMNSLHNIYF